MNPPPYPQQGGFPPQQIGPMTYPQGMPTATYPPQNVPPPIFGGMQFV